MERGYFVSHRYEYDDTKETNLEWCIGMVEALCIVSQIGLLPMKVARDLVEAREALFRYIGLRLLAIIMKIWGELILRA